MKTKKKIKINGKELWAKYKIPCIIVLAVIVLILLLPLFSIKKDKTEYKATKYLYDQNKLITIYDKGLYGFITPSGKVVVKPKYDFVIDTVGKYAVVEKDGTYYLLDKHGKEKISSKSAVTYDPVNDVYVADGKLYNAKLNAISPKKANVISAGHGYYRYISEDGKTVGFIDAKGKVIYKKEVESGTILYIYVGSVDVDQKEIYGAISLNNQYYAIVNCKTGKIVKDFSGTTISANGNNVFTMQKGQGDPVQTVYVQNNKIVWKEDNVTDVIFNEDYISYFKDSKIQYYNIKKKKVEDSLPEGKTVERYSEWETKTGLNRITCTKYYGIINDEKVVLPCEYSKITFLPYVLYDYLSTKGKEIVLTQKEGKTYIVNLKNNKKLHSFDTTTVFNTLVSSPIIYYYNEENHIVAYNLFSNKEKTFDGETIDVFGNYFKVHQDKKITYYNLDYKKIYETED